MVYHRVYYVETTKYGMLVIFCSKSGGMQVVFVYILNKMKEIKFFFPLLGTMLR
jgi:hypothetical protein